MQPARSRRGSPGSSPADARFLQRGLELGVGDELPAARELDVRLLFDLVRTSGLFVIPERNDAVSEAIRTEPASAVPSDAPNWLAVFWEATDLGALLVGTAETVTLPSCEARAPIPSPIRISGTARCAAVASTSIVVKSTTIPINTARSPSSTTRRGETAGKNLGMPAAASSIASESGVILSPVSIAERPRATDR